MEKLDGVLRSMYLQLDTTTKYLTRNAESQLLVKIIFQHHNSTFKEICRFYKDFVNCENEERLDAVLSELIKNGEIVKKNGKYSIPKSKAEKIKLALEESQNRFQRIIDNFKPFFSDSKVVSEWLIDGMMHFFGTFSDDWISDLCYKANAIARREDSILDVIKKRTANNKDLHRQDKEELPRKFLQLILKRELDITHFLWEYGTAAFSAKLIKNSYTTDDLTLETFKDCHCILDTNILMHIGLESSEYYTSFKVLENVFKELGINAGILYITQREYITAVQNKKEQVINLVAKYDREVLEASSDQYLKTAIKRHCKTEEDYKCFFSSLEQVPKHIYENTPINLYDDDQVLEEKIIKAQSDETKLSELNSIYKNITGKNKRDNALLHDVGLINGAHYLRDNGKYFILSQEVSVNTYAKQKPFVNKLPIAMRIQTLLNVLALNGNTHIVNEDYKSLFANMIREGLQPNSDTFTAADLSIMLEKNEQISKLPSNKIIEIANQIHQERLLDVSENQITMNMTRKIQGAKIEVVEDLSKTKQELSAERKEKEHFKSSADKSEQALRLQIEKEVRKEFRSNCIRLWTKRILLCILICIALIITVLILGRIDFIKQVSFWIFTLVCAIIPIGQGSNKYFKQKKTKECYIKEEVERRLNSYLYS
jgi:membrane protein